MAEMHTGQHGLRLIKSFEGCRLTAYRDIVGIWTIGYGDTLNVVPGQTITQEEAEARLLYRLRLSFEPPVNNICKHVATTQNEFDAMVSLAYNIGRTAFSNSTLARYHFAGSKNAAANEFHKWVKAGGRTIGALKTRRLAEETLYLTPD